MKRIRLKYSIIQLACILLLAAASCKRPNDDTGVSPVNNTNANNSSATGSSDRTIYVINEGNFTSSNGSVSLYNPRTNVAQNDVFKNINNRSLGDVVQSMSIINGNAYFVVNNSNKIEIANERTMESIGVINGLSLPRYILSVNPYKAYVSEYVNYGGNGRISIVDLSSNTIKSSIPVGGLPENMLFLNNKLYVTNSNDNTVSVINTATDVVETTITVAQGPNGIKLDASGNIWVLCAGEIAYDASWNVDPVNSIAGAFVKINPATNAVENTYTLNSKIGSPSKLCMNGAKNKFYFFYLNAVYSFDINTGIASSNALINRNFYGLGVDPIDDKIYVGTYGFTSNQQLIRYTTSGVAIDSTTVGIGTNGFVFN